MKKNNKGFSLVELIIVIAIMAVLIGVLAPQFIKYVEQGRRSTDITNAEEIRNAILADIADAQITGTGSLVEFDGAATMGHSASTIAAVPTIQGNLVNNGGHFYVTYNAATGVCQVFADSAGTHELTNAAAAQTYKTATTP